MAVFNSSELDLYHFQQSKNGIWPSRCTLH